MFPRDISMKKWILALTISCLLLTSCKSTTAPNSSLNNNNILSKNHNKNIIKIPKLSQFEIKSIFDEIISKHEVTNDYDNFIHELKEFENIHSLNWSSAWLVNNAKGYAYLAKSTEVNTDKEKVVLYNSAKKEFNLAFENIDNDIPLSSTENSELNFGLCKSKYFAIYFDSKEKTEKVLSELFDIAQNEACPINYRAWSLSDSLSTRIDMDEYKLRMKYAHSYSKNGNHFNAIMYIAKALAWAEYSIGNNKQAIKTFSYLETLDLEDNPIFSTNDYFQSIKRDKQKAIDSLKKENCNKYWISKDSQGKEERIIYDVIQDFLEVDRLFLDGISKTKPVYKTLTYSKERIVTSYNVSSLIYRAQSKSERLKSTLNNIDSSHYTASINSIKSASDLSNKAISLRLKGYFLKAKDYRGEWEQSDALRVESLSITTSTIKEFKHKFLTLPNGECAIKTLDFINKDLDRIINL